MASQVWLEKRAAKSGETFRVFEGIARYTCFCAWAFALGKIRTSGKQDRKKSTRNGQT
jgi:hypothetical protein